MFSGETNVGEQNLADIINADDFKQIRHMVFMKNETSQTHFSEADNIIILELGFNYLVLEGPAKSCQNGHQISLNLTPFIKKDAQTKKTPNLYTHENLLKLVAKVDDYEVDSPKAQRARWRVNLTQYNKEDWAYLHSIYETHQRNINLMVAEKDS